MSLDHTVWVASERQEKAVLVGGGGGGGGGGGEVITSLTEVVGHEAFTQT